MEEVEEFHGCYLLYCMNPRFKGRTYIGYTVNPERRIAQHNAGSDKGGACRTSGRGPWSMTLIVHGFPNEISGLRFEWAWTYPHASRRLRHLFPAEYRAKGNKETKFDFCVRVMLSMINTKPWNRLPLTVRWLDENFRRDFPPTLQPPLHMPVTTGWIRCTKVKDDGGKSNRYAKGKKAGKTTKGKMTAVKTKGKENAGNNVRKGPKSASDADGASLSGTQSDSDDDDSDDDDVSDEDADEELMYRHSADECSLCGRSFSKTDASLRCLFVSSCGAEFHIICLSKNFLAAETKRTGERQIIPVTGTCPGCGEELNWGDLVRFKKGCYRKELEGGSGKVAGDEEEHWADLLTQR